MSGGEAITSLSFKPDFEEAKQRWLAFWEGEMLDRPVCNMLAPKDGHHYVPTPKYMAGAREAFDTVIPQVLAHAESIYWGGDAIPCYTPSFGPDQMAAFLGGEILFPEEETRTNWVKPCIDDWEKALPLRLDPENPWWTRMLAFMDALAEALQGKMLVTHLDLHSNADALLALRGGERLCLDMIDIPETIDRAMASVRRLYVPIYEQLYRAGRMDTVGTLGWVRAYHPVRTNTIQCDFAALIGPKQFRRFVLPALEEEAAYLGHCVYHLDGPECLVHLDDLCAIPGLDCIQWTTGARNKPFIEWMDLLKEIQAKGVAVWVPCNTEEIKIYHRELRPDRVFYDCSAPNPQEAEATLEWLKKNS
ncbi:MAG TPA: hypothetical protein GX715_05085 [Armatimonadetes bacterium]|nr:hypothetical protein [Armatimonadota bacterium]